MRTEVLTKEDGSRVMTAYPEGYKGPGQKFLTQAEAQAWEAKQPSRYPAVVAKARAWLTPGVPQAVYGSPPGAEHVLVVVAESAVP